MVALEKGDHAGIKIAAARPHDQTFDRRKTHRGVDGAAVIDRTKRRTIAKMAADKLQLVRPLLQELRRAETHIMMRGTVETVTTDRFLFIELIRQRVEEGIGGE